jgi:hypothetical protein
MRGYFLYRIKLPKHTFIIQNGYAYTLEADEEKLTKRYKINNWSTG